MIRRRTRLVLVALVLVLVALRPNGAQAFAPPTPEQSVQDFLAAQPGPLASFREGDRTAAEWIEGATDYYGVSPRVTLALLEATNQLLSDPAPPDEALARPFGPAGPHGFGAQVDWAARNLRAGLGPYDRPPVVSFTDGTTLTLTLDQAPEGVAVQRLLAHGRTQAEWRDLFGRFTQAFQIYFNNELPLEQPPEPAAARGFLQRPWPADVRVVHLAYFDHMFPTVDTGRRDNGFVVNYLGRGSVQYDGHDGHDFYFPAQPIGTPILAAADGVAFARTHRGNGVVIIHPDGYETVYWHLDKFAKVFKGKVDTDQGVRVKAGDLLGTSGKTGFTSGTPHLHFEVRHNGRQVDPYGWYGPGADPCAEYAGCEASAWLWDASLAGEFDLTPPDVAAPDRTPPQATLTVNPLPGLLFQASFDDGPLQQLGAGAPTVDGTLEQRATRFGRGLAVGGGDRLALPVQGNMRAEAGTIALWVELPATYPATSTGRNYLFSASAHPGEGPVYTGTLALRRDLLGPDNAPRWDFWTTPESGDAGRNDLSVPDTLGPGPHQFTLTWDRERGEKALYIDGALAARATNVELPRDVGALLELGRFMPGHGQGGAVIDELAIFGRALDAEEVGLLADAPLQPGASAVGSSELALDLNAVDNAGGIMSVQIGVDGAFGDPQPYGEGYAARLPQATGVYTIAARVSDRVGNSTVVSATVELADLPLVSIGIADQDETGITFLFARTDTLTGTELQLSDTPDFDGVPWQPLQPQIVWRWPLFGSRAVWVRFRDERGLIGPARGFGPDANAVYLPVVRSADGR